MKTEDVEIVETSPIGIKERLTAVMGFSSTGFVGSTAVNFIVRNKGLRPSAYIQSSLIPPMMILIEGHPYHPFRIYLDEKENLLFATSETILSPENSWVVTHKLMDWLLEKGVKKFVSIDVLLMSQIPKERTILGFSSHGENLNKFGVQPTLEGVITGINASLMEECMRRGFPWTTLFVPTNVVSAPDFGGAAAIVQVLNQMFKLGVDVSPLIERDNMMQQLTQRRAGRERRGILDSLRRRD